MTDLYRNQSSILNVEDYDYLKIAIIGLGSIGSFLAIALNKLGFKNLILIDDDIIEAHNVTTQFYFKNSIGGTKVNTISQHLTGNISAYNTRVTPLNKIDADIVFICVDTLKQRKFITKSILDSYEEFNKPRLIIDGRMHRLIFQVHTIPIENQELLNKYVESTMEKEFTGACTEKGIIQNVFAVVSMMVEQLKKVLKGEEYYATIHTDFERLMFVTTDLQKSTKEDNTEEMIDVGE